MENGKRAKGKSKQISAKKKIIWSVDLVEVQKDEDGGDLRAGLYQMGFVALLTNAQCFSPEILRLFSRICPADDARTSNYYRIPFDNFCQNLLTVWEWKFFLRRRIWTFQSDVSIPGGWICHCSYSCIALNKFIPFQNFVNCSKKIPREEMNEALATLRFRWFGQGTKTFFSIDVFPLPGCLVVCSFVTMSKLPLTQGCWLHPSDQSQGKNAFSRPDQISTGKRNGWSSQYFAKSTVGLVSESFIICYWRVSKLCVANTRVFVCSCSCASISILGR